MDARQLAIGRKEALALAQKVDEIYASKGKKLVHVDLRQNRLADDQIAGLLLGPTGNLRAPTIKQGRKLIVGFDESTYAKLLI